jgi:hypothetical protein
MSAVEAKAVASNLCRTNYFQRDPLTRPRWYPALESLSPGAAALTSAAGAKTEQKRAEQTQKLR